MEHSFDAIMEVVYDINEHIYDSIGDNFERFSISLISDGFSWAIVLGEICFFSSENDHIEYNSDEEFYKKLKVKLLKEIKTYKKIIEKINLNIKS